MASSALPVFIAPQEISQGELANIIYLRDVVKKLQDELDKAESLVREALAAGAIVESGIMKAYLTENERRSPAWKVVVERLADRLHEIDPKHPGGAGYCALVLARTAPTVSVRLVVKS